MHTPRTARAVAHKSCIIPGTEWCAIETRRQHVASAPRNHSMQCDNLTHDIEIRDAELETARPAKPHNCDDRCCFKPMGDYVCARWAEACKIRDEDTKQANEDTKQANEVIAKLRALPPWTCDCGNTVQAGQVPLCRSCVPSKDWGELTPVPEEGNCVKCNYLTLWRTSTAWLIVKVPVPEPEPRFTIEEIRLACKNFGIDITCGRCAGIFFTGAATEPHCSHCPMLAMAS